MIETLWYVRSGEKKGVLERQPSNTRQGSPAIADKQYARSLYEQRSLTGDIHAVIIIILSTAELR